MVSTTPGEPETAAVPVRLPIHNPPAELRTAVGCMAFLGVVFAVLAGLLVWARSQDPVVYLVAPALGVLALACFCFRPILRRYIRRNGGMVTARVEFGPDGFRQPLEDKTTLVLPWDDVRRFVFREGQPEDRVALAVSLVDDDALRNLNPDCRHESEDGFILSSSMAREEAEKALAAIERHRPGLSRWNSKNVRRGGFGVPNPVKLLVKRWRADQPGTLVRAEQASAVRLVFLWTAWLAVIADFVSPAFYDIPPGIPLPVAVAIWVLLYLTRYRGDFGEFAVTVDAVTWRPKEGEPVVVRRTDLARLTIEPSGKKATRHYVAVHAVRRNGSDRPLAGKISPGAAEHVLALVPVRPAE
ncbi:hypothetical protein Amsp01_023890 [Amycolatopsis sp. NBRC 101858]|uniref:hypothetical protein n=1 Tax=Amycolatopsis sp. NBRC 101858 TaxID=3032200 RepID=UPI0024A369F6|nr:hypothetical protein [Amycolatopsis sp. NBRC 101858]GLY36365.1 hypothetical protein Amsp01_023890 [Amycolatopsis sp. NBRC 101858]